MNRHALPDPVAQARPGPPAGLGSRWWSPLSVLLRRLAGLLGLGSRWPRRSLSPGKQLGARGEALAARHLRRNGYRILARNARVPMGEADLIAEDRATGAFVLVEVKSRRAAGPDEPPLPPELNIDAPKRAKLRSILRHLAKANRWPADRCRIDVVAVELDPAGKRATAIRHHRGAV